MNHEYYELLGVSEDASDEEIKESYRALKKKYNEERGALAGRRSGQQRRAHAAEAGRRV